MACRTKCVLSWETNRPRESAVRDGNLLASKRPFFARILIHDSSSLGAAARGRCDRITSPQSRIEARLSFCLISFGDDPEAPRPCRPQTSDRRQSVDRISALVCPLFRSKSPSFVAS